MASKSSTSRTHNWLDFLESTAKKDGKIVRVIRGSCLGAAITLEERRFLEDRTCAPQRMIVPSSTATDRGLMQRREESVARGVATTHPLFVERGRCGRLGRRRAPLRRLRRRHRHVQRRSCQPGGGRRDLRTGRAPDARVLPSRDVRTVCRRRRSAAPARPRRRHRRIRCCCSTGAEATENAVKIAREYHAPARAVIAFRHGYHGRTLLALSMTGKERTLQANTSARSAAISITRRFPTSTTASRRSARFTPLEEIFEGARRRRPRRGDHLRTGAG